jgi:hypothetical protein
MEPLPSARVAASDQDAGEPLAPLAAETGLARRGKSSGLA